MPCGASRPAARPRSAAFRAGSRAAAGAPPPARPGPGAPERYRPAARNFLRMDPASIAWARDLSRMNRGADCTSAGAGSSWLASPSSMSNSRGVVMVSISAPCRSAISRFGSPRSHPRSVASHRPHASTSSTPTASAPPGCGPKDRDRPGKGAPRPATDCPGSESSVGSLSRGRQASGYASAAGSARLSGRAPSATASRASGHQRPSLRSASIRSFE
jgi:hypothetical protein